MKSYCKNTINLLNQSILQDEFNDLSQNKRAYDNQISGSRELTHLLNAEQGNNKSILNIGSGAFDIPILWKDLIIYNLEPCPNRSTENTWEGWCENIPKEIAPVDLIICWGTFCFVRGIQESLVQFNQTLKLKGILIVDIVEYTTMALAQTTNPECFVRYVGMFGFRMKEEIQFGESHHKRVAFRFEKIREFDPSWMRMPQTVDKINNYLPERDWYLK